MKNKIGLFFLLAMIALSFACYADSLKPMTIHISIPSGRVVSFQGDTDLLFTPTTIGSTVKPFLAIAALDYGWTGDESVWCPKSSVNVKPCERCWLVKGHGKVDLKSAIANSCTVYFRHLVQIIPRDKIIRILRDFRLLEQLTDSQVTALTIEDFIGAGDGLRVRPDRLLGAYVRAFGGANILRYKIENQQLIPVIGSLPGTFEKMNIVKDGMQKGAIFGTFRHVKNVKSMSVFGKTGTASSLTRGMKYQGLFVAFTPFPIPDEAVLVLVPNGRGAGDAAPIGIRALRQE